MLIEHSSQSHTGIAMAKVFQAMLMRFGLKEKVCHEL